jgi:hypothetical protein
MTPVETAVVWGVRTMPEPLLEQVFKTNGVPTYTFVEPLEWSRLLGNLRSPGRGLVIEGPSGIGKTTAVDKALEHLGMTKSVAKLSARRPKDVELIKSLPEITGGGVVIVDDFHRLGADVRAALADHMKTLADAHQPDKREPGERPALAGNPGPIGVGRRVSTWSCPGHVLYRFTLWSDFTFFANDPVHGDEIEQDDDRWVIGTDVRARRHDHWQGMTFTSTAGIQARNDSTEDDEFYGGTFRHRSRRLRCVTRPAPRARRS